MEKGIKETKELIEAMGEAAVLGKKISKLLKEHGVSPMLLAAISDIADALPEIQEGIEGVKEVPAELKDLEESEVLEIIGALYSEAKKLNEA